MKYIRLVEVMNTQELTMIKLALSKENVDFKTLFENTLRTADVYALGNSGAIIEVAEADLGKSKRILSELGIEIDYDTKEDRFEFVEKIDQLTKNAPIIGKWELGYRFMLIAILSALTLFSLIFLNVIRISENEIVGHLWCVDEIIHDGVRLQPNTTTGIVIVGYREKCKEDILFLKYGLISLPGFDTYAVKGSFEFKTDNIFTIRGVDAFKDIYEGRYVIKTNWLGTMEFVSDRTTITISRMH